MIDNDSRTYDWTLYNNGALTDITMYKGTCIV